MSETRCSVRVAGLALAGAVSVALALLIAERVVRPGVISEVQTPMLLGLVLLFVLPVLTYFAARQDERSAVTEAFARRAPRPPRPPERAEGGPRDGHTISPSPMVIGDDGPESPGRAIRHGAHDRVPPVPAPRGVPKAPAAHTE